MSTLALEPLAGLGLRVEELGTLTPIGRPGGQGRVYRPAVVPAALGGAPVVVKMYRRPPSAAAVRSLGQMIEWGRSLEWQVHRRLHEISAWPLAIVTRAEIPVGIAMHDLSDRFAVPFVMPSGRRQHVLLSLEHLLGSDDYLELRGQGVRLDTAMRVRVAEHVSGALAFLHRHAIVASDIAPNNLLVAFGTDGPAVCFIDCDSMVFHGHQALPAVETADWQMPIDFAEPPRTRAADAYKLGLIVLRLLARSHDARKAPPSGAADHSDKAPPSGAADHSDKAPPSGAADHSNPLSSDARHVPAELLPLLARALGPDPANRPPAGEWQRALRELSARGGLNARYPGPAPKPRLRPPSSPVSPRTERDLRSAPAHARPPAARPAPARPSRSHTGTLVWLALAAVILWLLLARLYAAATPTSGGTSFGSGVPGQSGNVPQYYYPSGPGSVR